MKDKVIYRKMIKNRYEKESQNSYSLGCGSNLSHLSIEQGEIILDLGCGRGEETILAARSTGKNGFVHGLDITPAMLAEAEKNAKAAGTLNVDFTVGDIEKLPYESNFFNAATSNCVINHARDKQQAYREIYRVLKPDGRFVVSDAVSVDPLPLSVKNDPEAWAQCYGGAVTEAEYLKAVSLAGFSSIETLNRREYLKNGFDFVSLTIKAYK